MNYMLHNYTDSYNKPVDSKLFRVLALRTLKDNLPHLYQEYMGSDDDYNISKWLINIPALESGIESEKLSLEKAKKDLSDFINQDEDSLHKQYSNEELEVAETYHNSKASYYADEAENAKMRLGEFDKLYHQFVFTDVSKEFSNKIKKQLKDIYDGCCEDISEMAKKDTESVLDMHNYVPIGYDEWYKRKFDNLTRWLENRKNDLRSRKANLEKSKKINEYITAFFEELDKIDPPENK